MELVVLRGRNPRARRDWPVPNRRFSEKLIFSSKKATIVPNHYKCV